MKLRAYQDAAADFLYEHDRAIVQAWVGAGKTATALTAMRDILRGGHAERFLVLAPARVVDEVWQQEGALWAPELRIALVRGDPKQRLAAIASDAQVLVATYDGLQWLVQQPLNCDALVLDELTRVKNPSGLRFKALEKMLPAFRIRWGLTGSFTSNGLEDVFGQCKVIDQQILGRAKGAFLQQYFYCLSREYSDYAPRPGALEQVMQRIRPWTFQLDNAEYRDKLPPLHVIDLNITADLTAYKRMKRELALEFPDAAAVAANAGVVTSKLQQLASGFVYADTGPRWLSAHKFDRLQEVLDENQRACSIVAYTFREELAELKRRYPKAQTLDDADAVARWNRGEIEMLLVHPKSAGHGLNLQHGGHTLIFLSLPWSQELYEQTIGRLHRSGQRNAVQVYRLLTRGTVDETIAETLANKRTLSNLAWEALK